MKNSILFTAPDLCCKDIAVCSGGFTYDYLFFGVSVYTLQISAYRLIIDFLVPFNVSCCICFRLLYSKWNDMEYIAVFLSIACIFIWTLIVSTDSIYQRISMPIWGSLLIISFGYLIFCVHKSQCNCEINWEVKSSGTAI